jgi:hypothetical protein
VFDSCDREREDLDCSPKAVGLREERRPLRVEKRWGEALGPTAMSIRNLFLITLLLAGVVALAA